MKTLDLFHGAGAMALGFESAGFVPAAGYGTDDDAARAYAVNRPQTQTLIAPVTSIEPMALAKAVGKVVAVIGGAPMGHHTNEWMARVVGAVAPDVFAFEGVDVDVSSPEWMRAKGALAAVGYDVDVWPMRASEHGVAQARKRNFLVGARGKLPPAPAPSAPTPTMGEVLAGLPAPTPDTADSLHRGPRAVKGRAAKELAKAGPGSILRSRAGDVVGDCNSMSRPVTADSRIVHWTKKRWLTPREHARLQGFPDDYAFPATPGAAVEMIGKSVPVGVAAVVAKTLATAINKSLPRLGPDELVGAFTGVFREIGWGDLKPIEKSVFGSPSSKRMVAKKIAELLPAHSTYVEPFVGSGAVLFSKEPAATEVIADLNGDITRAYKTIRGLNAKDIERLEKSEWRGDYETWKKLKEAQPVDDVDHLHRFLYVQRFSLGGFNNHRAFRHDNTGVMSRSLDRLKKNVDRVRNVRIVDGDYERPMSAFDGPETVFFLDPPYAGKDAGVGEKGFDETRLLKVLDGVSGKFVLTYTADSPIVEELAKRDLDVRFFETPRVMARWRGGDPSLRHVIAANFDMGEAAWLSRVRPLPPATAVSKRYRGTLVGVETPDGYKPLPEPRHMPAEVQVDAHEQLVAEMIRRGLSHDSPLEGPVLHHVDGFWRAEQPIVGDFDALNASRASLPSSGMIEHERPAVSVVSATTGGFDVGVIHKSVVDGIFTAPKDIAEYAIAGHALAYDDGGKPLKRFDAIRKWQGDIAGQVKMSLRTLRRIRAYMASRTDDDDTVKALGGAATRAWIAAIFERLAEVERQPIEDSAVGNTVEAVIVKRAGDVVGESEEERTVTGIVLEPDGIDAQGDTIDAAVIRASAHRFLSSYNRALGTRLGFMHNDFSRTFELLESWIVPTDMVIGGRRLKAGTWVMTVRVLDDEVWTGVKIGRFKGFSIGGVARVQRLVPA